MLLLEPTVTYIVSERQGEAESLSIQLPLRLVGHVRHDNLECDGTLKHNVTRHVNGTSR